MHDDDSHQRAGCNMQDVKGVRTNAQMRKDLNWTLHEHAMRVSWKLQQMPSEAG